MTLENLDVWAKKKGLQVVGTSDFTHPRWMAEIENKLEPAESGLYRLRQNSAGTRFMLTTEISSIYSRGNKTRRVHNLIFMPDLESAKKFIQELERRGCNLLSDGRPIVGIDSEDLLKLIKEIDEEAVLVPAHAWTPWFSVFGSMSGFDSLEECFGENARHIFAIETGLSSSPEMNWRLSSLDQIALISNSDAHSLSRLGREANVFDTELNYEAIMEAIKSRDKEKFLMTIEYFPEEGKYHYDGHRLCGQSFSPAETKKLGQRCPSCGRPLTIGVLNRVDALADRPEGFEDKERIPFQKLVPLEEIIAEAFGVGVNSKKVQEEYEKMIAVLGSEIDILISKPENELLEKANSRVVEGILRVRRGEIMIMPGYDGEYGKIKIFKENQSQTAATLF